MTERNPLRSMPIAKRMLQRERRRRGDLSTSTAIARDGVQRPKDNDRVAVDLDRVATICRNDVNDASEITIEDGSHAFGTIAAALAEIVGQRRRVDNVDEQHNTVEASAGRLAATRGPASEMRDEQSRHVLQKQDPRPYARLAVRWRASASDRAAIA